MQCPRVDTNPFQPQDQKALFDCNENEGHSGQFVYLRDDREDKEYFGLCEVEVFVHKGESRPEEAASKAALFLLLPGDATTPIGAG